MSPKTGHPPKRRNPQDSTRRNVRASVKRDSAILVRLKALEHRVSDLENTKPFSASQKALDYRHSTSWPGKIRVKG